MGAFREVMNPQPAEHLPDAQATQGAGRRLASSLRGGAVIGLCGPLGAGKTHFTQGVVEGLGSRDWVSCPTFGLVHEYRSGRLPVIHLDFYRLQSPQELLRLGWDEWLDEPVVILAEWADRFAELMPAHTQWCRIEPCPQGGRLLRWLADAPPRSEAS